MKLKKKNTYIPYAYNSMPSGNHFKNWEKWLIWEGVRKAGRCSGQQAQDLTPLAVENILHKTN